MVKFENGNIRISVRNLVEFILRSGDIDNRYGGRRDREAMVLGGKIHRKIQRAMGAEYAAEVPLKIKLLYERFYISLEGRADGIITPITKGENIPDVIIDEIKSMYADVNEIHEPSMIHKAQAMCYGYIYGIKNNLNLIGIRLTYVNIDTEEIKLFEENCTMEYLAQWFEGLMGEYLKWANLVYDHREKRNKSAGQLEFPFPYRSGQREIAVNTYKAIRMGKELFIQAPTGVGKTMSVIFPAVKSIGENITDKIFYLTAKTVTGTVAHQAYRILREKGLIIKTLAVTAKEKICVMEETECNPVKCPRARGHFDRVNEAIFELISHEEDITREIILRYGEKYNVCPFEMCLDASYFADAVICDYNYAFDPVAKLKRYFSEGASGEYVFLVDEAHNLVDRAREMFSAGLCKERFLEAKRIIGVRDKRTTGCLERCNKNLLEKKRECGNNMYMLLENIEDFIIKAERLHSQLEKILEVYREFEGRDKVLQLYFDVSSFLSIYDTIDDGYRIVCQIDERGEFHIRLMCINPASNLKACMDMAVSTIMYSGTLLPVNYYKLLLKGNTEDYAIYVDSPFDSKKRLIAVGSDVSTRYTKRGADEYEKVAAYIDMVVSARKGNYMVFFPSYKFMEAVKVIYEEGYRDTQDIYVISQSPGMSENEREEFLGMFKETSQKSLVAFCIMGGIFSEGIDLVNEKLIGTIVVGTGFPQVCMEREIIKEYFDERNMNGFDFAYRYPGMNKVLQAAGRVIRTVDDVGVIVLLDYRFLSREYEGLFPREWADRKKVSRHTVSDEVKKFWDRR